MKSFQPSRRLRGGIPYGLGIALAATSVLLASCNESTSTPVQQTVKILAINDFHGNIDPPAETNGGAVTVKDTVTNLPVNVRSGGGAYLTTLINQQKATNPNNIVVAAGDNIGASPLTSTLTHQEAAVDVLNAIGLEVTSVGNHEFDASQAELKRMQNGGCFPGGTIGTDTCIINRQFGGAKFKFLSANVVDAQTKTPLFPASYIKNFGGLPVGFIGLTFKNTPTAVLAANTVGLSFLDEVESINAEAAKLVAGGARAVVVLIHQGGQTTAATINDQSCPGLSGDIVPIVDKLSSNINVVISGHSHQEYICNRNGKLLTSAGFYGNVLTSIDLSISSEKGFLSATAKNLPVANGLALATPTALPAGVTALEKNASTQAVIDSYNATTNAIKNLQVGSITADIKRALLANSPTPTRDETAEGAMGNVIADSIAAGIPGVDFAILNPGGVRDDLNYNGSGAANGVVTYAMAINVQPFGNDLGSIQLTGAQIIRLLEQQWESANCAAKQGINGCGRLLQPSSNLTYSWDASKPSGAADGQGARVIVSSVKIKGQAIDLNKIYTVGSQTFLITGGDNFTVMLKGANYLNTGYKDIASFTDYLKANAGLRPPTSRITKVN